MTWILLLAAVACACGAGAVFLRQGSIAAAVLLIVRGVGALAGSFVRVVPAGYVSVATLFGAVQKDVHPEGLHFTNPPVGLQQFTIRRTMFDFSGSKRHGSAGTEIVAVSSDSLRLTLDIGFPLGLNGPAAWKVYQRVGHQ